MTFVGAPPPVPEVIRYPRTFNFVHNGGWVSLRAEPGHICYLYRLEPHNSAQPVFYKLAQETGLLFYSCEMYTPPGWILVAIPRPDNSSGIDPRLRDLFDQPCWEIRDRIMHFATESIATSDGPLVANQHEAYRVACESLPMAHLQHHALLDSPFVNKAEELRRLPIAAATANNIRSWLVKNENRSRRLDEDVQPGDSYETVRARVDAEGNPWNVPTYPSKSYVERIALDILATPDDFLQLAQVARTFHSLRFTEININLSAFQSGKYVPTGELCPLPEMSGSTPLVADFREILQHPSRLGGSAIEFKGKGHIRAYFGSTANDFVDTERTNIEWLHHKVYEKFRFAEGFQFPESEDPNLECVPQSVSEFDKSVSHLVTDVSEVDEYYMSIAYSVRGRAGYGLGRQNYLLYYVFIYRMRKLRIRSRPKQISRKCVNITEQGLGVFSVS